MARSTREAILTAAAELMRRKGYGAVGMKDIAAASGAPIGSLYHHFRDGKVQIAREALVNAGAAYGLLIPTLVDPTRDLGEAIEGVFAQAAEGMAGRGSRICARSRAWPPRSPTPWRNFARRRPAIFRGWIDGGTAYFDASGLDEALAREVDAGPHRRAGGRVCPGAHAAQRRAAASGRGSTWPRSTGLARPACSAAPVR